VLAAIAARHDRLADLHAHFLRGDPSWFTNTIEPSLIGASEVRRVFLDAL
jgi:acyl-CoA thioesterase-1